MATINTKTLRASLPRLVERVRKGARYTVLYRSRPAFQIVPIDASAAAGRSGTEDALYGAEAVGTSTDGRTASDHDAILYGR